jgi:diguanylate cyclase (GGDEF)-like protein/PAS domain S-box-containing protein
MTVNASRKRKPSAKAVTRFFRKKASQKLASGKEFIHYLSHINDLKSEIELLTSYSTDTIYRLRYDTMKYDYISPTVVRLLGFSDKEMRQINVRSLILETRIVNDGMKKVENFTNLEEQRKRGDVNKWQADYLMKTKDGRKIWVSDISYPWFDKDGTIIGSVGSLRDISDRIDAENKAREELVRIANTDSLTGLSNRRVFFSRLEEEIKRCKRSRNDVSVLIVDIDHFKKINDTYGHDVGDFVLTGAAQLMKSCLRETDLAARLGGEEFGILLPDTPAEGAYWVAERIRSQMAKHSFAAGEKQVPLGCTVSIGVAGARFDQNMDANALYKIADTRLYIAKNTGRNQVSIDELVHLH